MSTGKINIDFQVVVSGDPKYLLIVDTSNWVHIETKPSIIEISLPGYTNPKVLSFYKSKVNIFNSTTLGYTCEANCEEELIDLPDGIYKIVVKGSPDTFYKERYIIRNEKLKYDFAKFVVENGVKNMVVNESFFESEQYRNIKANTELSESFIYDGKINEANYHLKEAQNLLEKYQDCNK